MFIVNAGDSNAVEAPKDPAQVKTLQFDLNCMNLPNSLIEMELPDGSRAVINGVELDPNSDPAKPTLLLTYERKEVQIAREEARAKENAHEDLDSLLDSLSS